VRPAKFTSPAKASVMLPAARTAPSGRPAALAWSGAARLVVAGPGDGTAAVQAVPASTASTPDATATTRRITTSPAYGLRRIGPAARQAAAPADGENARRTAVMLCCETLTACQLRRTGQVDLARYVSPAGVA
jgi:hypothetical protein